MSDSLTAAQRRVTTIAILASFVTSLDMSVTNVALPAIERDLHGGLITQQWVVDGYLITLSAVMLLAGAIADARGRVRVMRWGLIGFGLASVIIALAPTPAILIIGRLLQGAAGAFLLPSSLALITSRISGPAQGRAIGVWTSASTIAMIVGPVVGGLFTDYLSWRWVFVVGLIPLVFALRGLTKIDPDPVPDAAVRIDWIGGVTCALGLGLAVFALIEQPRFGWVSLGTLLPLGVGVAFFAFFLWWQTRTPNPLLPLSLFASRNFTWGNIATFFIYAALPLNGFVMGIYLQEGAGLSATAAGLVSLPITIFMVVLSSFWGGLAGTYGPRLFMTTGPLLLGAGSLLLLTVGEEFDYWTQVLPAMIVMGLGLSMTVAPLTSAVLGAAPAGRSGIASAVNNAVSRVAGLIVIALVSTIVGGALDLAGFHSATWVTAALFVIGGAASWVGIRNPAARASSPGA